MVAHSSAASTPSTVVQIPAAMLGGLVLNNGWHVMQLLPKSDGATGSAFSVGYSVRKASGEEGFLKALDFVSHLQQSIDVARDLQAMTEAFNFERDVLGACRRMSRVVTAIEEGTVTIPGVPFGTVQYLIFERAEKDARAHIDTFPEFDLAWALRALHHVAVGLFQMHRGGVAHQDLKPSNILVFQNGTSAKVSDLGRAAWRGHSGPFDGEVIPGDATYAPPEMLYGEPPSDWNTRRIGCDIYHLGSLILFFFSQVAMTPLLLRFLDKSFWPVAFGGQWTDNYQAVLPQIRSSFATALERFDRSLSGVMTPTMRAELVLTVRQLCDPDPRFRGRSGSLKQSLNPLTLERYVTKLDRMAREARTRK